MNDSSRPWRIVLIEDNPHDRKEVKSLLLRGSDRLYEFAEASTGAEGLRLCCEHPTDCLILDYDLPDMTAVEILSQLPRQGDDPPHNLAMPVVVLTGSMDLKLSRSVIRAGAHDFVSKDWMTADSLTRAVDNATERFQMSVELRQAQERLRLLDRAIAAASNGILIADAKAPGTPLTSVNPAFEALTGYRAGEVLGSPFDFLWGPQTAADARETITAALAEALPCRVTLVGQRKDRSAFWNDFSITPVRDGEGRLTHFVGVLSDVTEQRRSEEALRDNESRLRLALESSETGMWDWDLATDAVRWSPECYRIHALSEDEFDGTAQGFGRTIHPEDSGRLWETVRQSIDERSRYETEFRIVRPDGTVRWVTNRGRVAYDEAGRPLRMIGILSDITDRKRIEAQREQILDAERWARAETERVARIKDEFLATLSHELRTPLNAIVGWAEILKRSGSNPGLIREGVEVISRNAQAQSLLISDLLDMSRILSGKLKMEVELLAPNFVAAAAAETVKNTAEAKRLLLELQLGEGLPQIQGDAGRLQQVLWNLLSNAIKFTPAGGAITLSTAATDGDVRFTVEDTGQGFDPAFGPHLFDRFSQADASAARQHGGLGLGLSIVKQLVDLHGGTVAAQSGGSGQGSRFTVTLPAASAGEIPAGLASAAEDLAGADDRGDTSLAGITVLLVDDQPDALELARRLLAESGATVTTASSAQEAIERLRDLRPHALVSDIGMPEMDGLQLIREVRQRLRRSPSELPAVALTAFARPEDRDLALAAGYQAHLSKPIRPQLLVATVASLAKAAKAD